MASASAPTRSLPPLAPRLSLRERLAVLLGRPPAPRRPPARGYRDVRAPIRSAVDPRDIYLA